MVKKNWSMIWDLRKYGEIKDSAVELNDSGMIGDITGRLMDCQGNFVKVTIRIIKRDR